MTISNSDYTTVMSTMRTALASGSTVGGKDLKLVLDVVQDSVDRMTEVSEVYDEHIALLQAGGAGDISALVDAAETALDTAIGTLPTYTDNPIADGD